MLELPGLIDPHVHLREPGATHKEDFSSGTAAALAGGFTAVLAMPNTQPPITDSSSLTLAKAAARSKAYCDYGIYLGASEENTESAMDLAEEVCGMKMYLDQTYGPLRLEGLRSLRKHFNAWSVDKPIAIHAEGMSLAASLLYSGLYSRPVHVCHVSRIEEINLIRSAKEKGFPVTCEVTPHHLFLTEEDIPRLGVGRGEVRPRLAAPQDRDALWNNIAVIDCFATDHAPHTLTEKDSDDPPPGFPGLETALGLFLNAVREDRLSLDQVVSRMQTNPRKIFHLPEQIDTRILVDDAEEWIVHADQLQSRCGWTPFEGMRLVGHVRSVTLRGRQVYDGDNITVPAGYGTDLMSL
ncbi:MAG: amidohydrolase family protein [Anaerolineales bacterium]|nr:amidohydrolase family protein [Anaerolineales bacterium]